jgi:hypothetical protein
MMSLTHRGCAIGGRDLAADFDESSFTYNLPARHRIQSGSARCLAGAEIETRMMPGTSHRIPDDDSFTEGSAIVRALSANRENLGTKARQKDRLIANVAEEHSFLGNRLDCNSVGEIRSGYIAIVLAQPSSCISISGI